MSGGDCVIRIIRKQATGGHSFWLGLAVTFALTIVVLLAGCGADSMATTQEAKDSAQSSASAQISDSHAASGQELGAQQVSVSIDASNARAYNAKYPASLGAFTIDVQPGDSVLDALKATGVDFAMRGKGYVAAIGGIEEKACGRNSGWMYLVDGVAPNKTANDYILNGGESVCWAYTVTEGDVEVGQKGDSTSVR